MLVIAFFIEQINCLLAKHFEKGERRFMSVNNSVTINYAVELCYFPQPGLIPTPNLFLQPVAVSLIRQPRKRNTPRPSIWNGCLFPFEGTICFLPSYHKKKPIKICYAFSQPNRKLSMNIWVRICERKTLSSMMLEFLKLSA